MLFLILFRYLLAFYIIKLTALLNLYFTKMYSMWSVAQLKKELKKRGATLQGRKADLVNRLESYDRNFNFGLPQVSAENADEKMDLPGSENFHDINSNSVLPPLTKEKICLYFNEFNKKPDEGLRLYESRYLILCRSYNDQDYTYVKALGKATMKKLQYEINLKIHQSGIIEQASCECVAGSGILAHCKHVAMALYAVEHMVRDKRILRQLAPTEQLQTFHVPKRLFTSTPMKSESLLNKRKIENVIFSPCQYKISREKYNEKFRNLVVNYASTSSSTMPFKQLYEPANPYGVECDHGYAGLDSNILIKKLKLEDIDEQSIKNIEIETRGQSSNHLWRELHTNHITASRFHTICHLKNSSQGKFAKTLIAESNFFSRATNHGIINEKVALEKYMSEYDLSVQECGMFISIERPYLAASPDGLLCEETIIEIKCPYSSRNLEINETTVSYLEKGDIEGQYKLKVGSPYYYQIQGQLYCTNRLYCNLIIYTFKSMKVVFVGRDDTFITGMLLQLDQFYYTYFKEAILNKYLYKNYAEVIKK